MRLSELTREWPQQNSPAAAPPFVGPDVEVKGLALDSRKIKPGYLFGALPGFQVDGREFIGQAVDNGAVAVLAVTGTNLKKFDTPVSLITNDNPRRTIALMAARFYGAQPHVIAAVTGTNGKTSVATFTRQIWQRLGYEAASLGTLGIEPERPNAPAALTTPDPVELQRCLAELARDGFNHLAVEASSHGLDQSRLDGVAVTSAAFTNLSRDHLDYHGSMEGYLAAKCRLFDTLMTPGGTAVLNADVPEFEQLVEICNGRGLPILSYGSNGGDLKLVSRTPTPAGQSLKLEVLGETYETTFPVAGSFQAWNLLAALGLVISGGIAAEKAIAVIPSLSGVSGRVEYVGDSPKGGAIYVDYAHTPDALETVLTALRPHCDGRLWVVVGCGGDRDPGKRPMMGGIAERIADVAIITDDNPRSEDPASIRAAMMTAAPNGREIGDRREAIFTAVRELAADDLLVIAGKGHESGQKVGDIVHPFDDRDVAREAIAAIAKQTKSGGAGQ
ncbi:UDP-N-acetylmuramoyl-L-alanyl-D-glutamate--2,6-diaminopimelate ligase [Pelagibius sp. Alg239-R121]|uniref:UDP-N-acetylmuramoyl-L-alanyl-D-glutamate--2, 6-diaminopimelate ligase n=1 Tax=Pelagibius sp. Alg239-R121 TaxID=2993448 RepID=UPI002AC3289A|nr:UDP-N-acetylmuramoyl-L-alanyl-D-glutamate--2,6-diaminopimelate ligase [Pelagibius sp. Alg239-R121]